MNTSGFDGGVVDLKVGRFAGRLGGRISGKVLSVVAAAVLTACGGGGRDDGWFPPPFSCSVAGQQEWLSAYMNDWYFWYSVSPNPSPAGYADVPSYFDALLYTGNDPAFPKPDVWSYAQSQISYDRFFGDGRTLGYGLMVAGREVEGQPDAPLYARYVEPASPAAAAGLARGDQILTINGVPSSTVISTNNYDALSPTQSGTPLTLTVRNTGGDRTVTLSSAIYDIVPVANTSIVTTASGRPMGYVMVTDMLTQALNPLDAAFAQFKAAGVQEVAIDLRYNGGGLVSVASSLASYPAGSATSGKVFASLLYNDKRRSNNEDFRFNNYASALGLSRVYVLTGPRTCSASEQVINGLSPFVDVELVGDTTCGKPVGFLPQADGCGSVYSVVNFESVNALKEGRYFDGFAPTCAVAEDFSKPLGSSAEPLLAAARGLADGVACPVAADGRRQPQSVKRPVTGRFWAEPGERGGMVAK